MSQADVKVRQTSSGLLPDGEVERVTLYHFTNLDGLDAILKDGFIDTTFPGINPHKPFVAPDVVWMTSDEWSGGSADPRKTWEHPTRPGLIRFTVALPVDQVTGWGDFTCKWGKPAGETGWFLATIPAMRSWRLIDRPVTLDEWVEVRNMQDGAMVWPASDLTKTTQQAKVKTP